MLLVSWRLWKQHNSRVYDSQAATAARERRLLVEEGNEWTAAGFTALLLILVAVAGQRYRHLRLRLSRVCFSHVILLWFGWCAFAFLAPRLGFL